MGSLRLFETKRIRSVWNEEEQQWYFSVVDVVGALTDSANPRRYWSDLKKKLKAENAPVELYEKIVQLKMESHDGKMRLTDAANTKGILRLIQSIPSPKAEPFKLWLADVGARRLEEIENPELASERMRELYREKGYSEEWINLRQRGMAIRDSLTDEWKARGVREGKEYAILTAEISKATFGMNPGEYKQYKGLLRPGENLRDHMTDMELVLTMLGEASTTEIARTRDAQGMAENEKAAKDGGKIAGDARRQLEKETGRSVISKQNYKELPEREVRKRLNKCIH